MWPTLERPLPGLRDPITPWLRARGVPALVPLAIHAVVVAISLWGLYNAWLSLDEPWNNDAYGFYHMWENGLYDIPWLQRYAFVYSPVVAQVLTPLVNLFDWPTFSDVWNVIHLSALVLMVGPVWAAFLIWIVPWPTLPGYDNAVLATLDNGNPELILAFFVVLAYRWPGFWSGPMLMKVTPGIGLAWYVVRREWRKLAIAGAVTLGVVAVSFASAPDLWLDWFGLLASAVGAEPQAQIIPVPLLLRIPMSLLLIAWGARTNRFWTVPIGVMWSLPALALGGYAVAAGALAFTRLPWVPRVWMPDTPDAKPRGITRLQLRRAWLVAGAVIVAVGLVITFRYPLNGDVEYVLGGLATSQHPPWDVFVHRPLLYRLLMEPMSWLPMVGMVRLAGLGFAAVVGWALWRGTGRPAVAAAVGIALALAPAWFFLQPEWFAAGFAALAIATRRTPPLAAAFLVTTVAVKLATLPVAVAAFLLIALIDRDRGRLLRIAAWSAVMGTAWLAVTAVVEWGWVRDMSTLSQTSLLNGRLEHLDLLLGLLVVAPITILGLLMMPSRRWAATAVLVVVALLAILPLPLQGQPSMYHLAAVPVLAAALAAWKRPSLLPVVALLCAVTALPAWGWGDGRTNESWTDQVRVARHQAATLRDEIGAETPVTYLAYGSIPYYMRNPTDCRYPSPLWLLRGTDMETAADNRACLDDTDTWIVVQPSWFGSVPCDERIEVELLYACPPGSWTPEEVLDR